MRRVFIILAVLCLLRIVARQLVGVAGAGLPARFNRAASVAFLVALTVTLLGGAVVWIREARAKRGAKEEGEP